MTFDVDQVQQERVAAWAAAFVKVQADLPEIPKTKSAVVKTKTGSSYEYSYADLATVFNAVRPILATHKMAVNQEIRGGPGEIQVTTTLYHEDGWSEDFGPLTFPAGDTPQTAGSAITYARRYSLNAALGLAPEDDDDGQRGAPAPEEPLPPPQPSPKQWLAAQREEFRDWDGETQRAIYTQALEALKLKDVTSRKNAVLVFNWMKKAYDARGDG